MNTPNKLTMLRMIMIPFFVACMLIESIPHHFLWAFFIFLTASLTDMLDGYLARRDNLVTDFGKLMDPLADKLLVTSALICFVGLGTVPSVVAIIILSREFLVTSIRLVAAPKGRVIAADIFGKAKTVCQMSWMCYLMLSLAAQAAGVGAGFPFRTVHLALMLLTTALTVFSGFNYVWNNRDLLKG